MLCRQIKNMLEPFVTSNLAAGKMSYLIRLLSPMHNIIESALVHKNSFIFYMTI